MRFSRYRDTSVLGQWWAGLDKWTLAAIGLLMGSGIVLILAASPPVSERIGLNSFALAKRHLLLFPVAVILLITSSLLPLAWIRRLAVIGVLGSLLLVIATLLFGSEIKGATRWINLMGFSLQPSEFLKPCFAVMTAWLFALAREKTDFPGRFLATCLFLLCTLLLLLQPDVGQSFLITAIFGVELFLAGLSLAWIIIMILGAVCTLVLAYFLMPHVSARIDAFLDPNAGNQYQVSKSLEAFENGGLFGTGPGEGKVKAHIPDAHSDFIFAVAGEELGAIFCVILVVLFVFLILRGLSRVFAKNNLFSILAVAGLLTQFGLQAFINMASSLNLMPTKGMTLPFISYGGSSLLAISITMGFVLALTKKPLGRQGGVTPSHLENTLITPHRSTLIE